MPGLKTFIKKTYFLFNLPNKHYTVSSYNVIVVHADIVPGLALDQQSSSDMVAMRWVVKQSDGRYSGTRKKFVGPWAASCHGPQHVYFGHNASRSLQQHPFTTGLHIGCVYGRCYDQFTQSTTSSVSCDSERSL